MENIRKAAIASVLASARELLDNELRWTQGSPAKHGIHTCAIRDPAATCFSVYGAIAKCAFQIGDENADLHRRMDYYVELIWQANYRMQMAVRKNGQTCDSIETWNDAATHDDILDALDAAINDLLVEANLTVGGSNTVAVFDNAIEALNGDKA